MDDDLPQWLFDPSDAQRLVLARRPPGSTAMTSVVSDVVWHDVVHLLRWSASTTTSADVDAGRWWRLAAACADLLRRLPALCDELGEPWDVTVPTEDRAMPGRARVAETTVRLAGEVDALGSAAISAFAQASSWAVPERP
jgi:hypothetical protein